MISDKGLSFDPGPDNHSFAPTCPQSQLAQQWRQKKAADTGEAAQAAADMPAASWPTRIRIWRKRLQLQLLVPNLEFQFVVRLAHPARAGHAFA